MLEVIQCIPGSPGKLPAVLSTSCAQQDPWQGGTASPWCGIHGLGYLLESACTLQCQTLLRVAGWLGLFVCLFAALPFPALSGEFAGCSVSLGRGDWVWLEALPQPEPDAAEVSLPHGSCGDQI